MIRRYDYGRPLPTGAVILTLEAEASALPYFTVTREGAALTFGLTLAEDDMIFGLGEAIRGVNKRGHRYRAWNSDDPSHTENKASLYAAHNLLLFSGPEKRFGVYFDDPGAVSFDLGFTTMSAAAVTSENGDLSVYLIEAESLTEICREFRRLTGRSYMPPRWALGYIQSRWGYASDAEMRQVVAEHRLRHIPLDGVCMDIDYMDHFKDFTYNQEAFPNLSGLTADMKREHVRLIPIIDAGVKQEDGYDVYDEGLRKGYFALKEDGAPFVAAVWPGRSCFPDFLRPEVRDWFGRCYHRLLDAGVEGFWNDMNEPALFYSEEGLAHAYREAEALRGQNIELEGAWQLQNLFINLANSPEDYRRFYHMVDGRRVRHDKVHNLYGAFMTRAAAEGFAAYDADKRFLLFSRSSFIGAHRDGGVWQGDNCSWWSHLKMNLQMMPSLNMCGFLYSGADLGGFGCDTTEDLLLRWLQLGVFTPLMRNHTALHSRPQETYRFASWEKMRDVITVRYALLPYLYSELMKAILTDGMLFRPLAFDYPEDATACRVEDQVMLGEDCMIAPVYEQNARGRHVYLPEDMLLIRFRSAEDYDCEPLGKGHHWLSLDLCEFPLLVRRGRVVPLARSAEWSEAVDDTDLTLLGWLDGPCRFTLYSDDGVSRAVSLESGLRHGEVTMDAGRFSARGDGMTLHLGRLLQTRAR